MSIFEIPTERLLLGPGPSNVHSSVREAMSQPLLGHLDPSFIALLDRLLHHAIVIEIAGNSYRLRQHAKLVPENLRLPPITPPEPAKKRRGRPPKSTED